MAIYLEKAKTVSLLMFVVVWDCPRNITIEPPNACQAGTVLTCTADSYPPATYVWVDLYTNKIVSTTQTYTLPYGPYRLMCIATANAYCSQQQSRVCQETGSLYRHYNYSGDTAFPFSLFNLTAVDYNVTENCTANTTTDGFANCKY